MIPSALLQALVARLKGGNARGMPPAGAGSLGMKREAALPDLALPGYRGEAMGSEGLGMDLGALLAQGQGAGGSGYDPEAEAMMRGMGLDPNADTYEREAISQGMIEGPQQSPPPPGEPMGGGAFLSPEGAFVDPQGFEVYDGDEEGPPASASPALQKAAKRRAGLRGKQSKKKAAPAKEKKPAK